MPGTQSDRPPRGKRPASSGDDLSVLGATLSSTPAEYELQVENGRTPDLVTGYR